MKKLIIIGAGGFGREIIQIVEDINKSKPTYKVIGFIDDNLNALDGKACSCEIIDTINHHTIRQDCYYVCGIANPAIKEKVMTEFANAGASFESIIHTTACISEFADIGIGLVAYPGAWIGANATIGDFVTLLSSGIGHDSIVGNYTTISGNCDIARSVKIGKRCFLGSTVCITPEKKVYDDAYICAGSVVFSTVRKGTKVIGNPARKFDLG